jgi:hypothetical protein
MIGDAVKYIKQINGSNWDKNHGADHLFAVGYDWGACFATSRSDAGAFGRPTVIENARIIGKSFESL